MGLKVYRRPKETPQGLVYRFTRAIRRSGILLNTRKKQFHKPGKSDLAKKKAALRRVELKKEYEKLRKMGKLKK